MLRIRGVYPGSRIPIFTHPGSGISDPGSKNSNERQRWKKNLFSYLFFGAINFTKLSYFYFLPKKLSLSSQNYGSKNGSKNSNERQRWKKNLLSYLCFWSNKFHKIELFLLFNQKIVTKLSKIWVWDPGSEIRKKPIPDPGSWGQKGTGSRIRIRNTAWDLLLLVNKLDLFIFDGQTAPLPNHPFLYPRYCNDKGTCSIFSLRVPPEIYRDYPLPFSVAQGIFWLSWLLRSAVHLIAGGKGSLYSRTLLAVPKRLNYCCIMHILPFVISAGSLLLIETVQYRHYPIHTVILYNFSRYDNGSINYPGSCIDISVRIVTKFREIGPLLIFSTSLSNVADPWHFGVDPDPRIHASD